MSPAEGGLGSRGLPSSPESGLYHTIQYEYYIGTYSRVCFRPGFTPGNGFTVGDSIQSSSRNDQADGSFERGVYTHLDSQAASDNNGNREVNTHAM